MREGAKRRSRDGKPLKHCWSHGHSMNAAYMLLAALAAVPSAEAASGELTTIARDPLWMRMLPRAVIWSAPIHTTAGDMLLAATESGTLTALRLVDGVSAWERDIPTPRGVQWAGGWGDHGIVYNSETAFGIELSSGAIAWATKPSNPTLRDGDPEHLPLIQNVVLSGATVAILRQLGTLEMRNVRTGELLWQEETAPHTFLHSCPPAFGLLTKVRDDSLQVKMKSRYTRAERKLFVQMEGTIWQDAGRFGLVAASREQLLHVSQPDFYYPYDEPSQSPLPPPHTLIRVNGLRAAAIGIARDSCAGWVLVASTEEGLLRAWRVSAEESWPAEWDRICMLGTFLPSAGLKELWAVKLNAAPHRLELETNRVYAVNDQHFRAFDLATGDTVHAGLCSELESERARRRGYLLNGELIVGFAQLWDLFPATKVALVGDDE